MRILKKVRYYLRLHNKELNSSKMKRNTHLTLKRILKLIEDHCQKVEKIERIKVEV